MNRWIAIVGAVILDVFVCFAQPRVPYYVITTVAGTLWIGDGGPATEALLYGPAAITLDNAGNLYIADTSYNRVRKVTPDGRISTIVGDGVHGSRGDGGTAESARLDAPVGLAVDSGGALYVLERAGGANGRLRKVTPDGKIRSVAVGPLATAQALAIDSAGNLFIAEAGKHVIRKVAPDGTVTTVAGRGSRGGAGDGAVATAAELNNPQGVTVDARGNLYIADTDNHRVRKVGADGIITTVAGGSQAGWRGDGGPATLALLNYPRGLAVDADGNVFISDGSNHRIRKVSAAGLINTVAGTGVLGFSGDGGPAFNAQFQWPAGLALDTAGNLYVADADNHRVRRVTPGGLISTVAGSSHFRGDGGPATSATLFAPGHLAVDAAGNLYIADRMNNRIRKVGVNAIITTVAGSSDTPGYSDGGGRAANAKLNLPDGLAVDASGTPHFADTANHRIYKITGSGEFIRVAGTGNWEHSGDGGSAVSAQMNFPRGLAFDRAGNLHIAVGNDHRVRKVGAADGVITTIAGNGSEGTGGDGGPATAAQLDFPHGVAADAEGNIYISSRDDDRVRKVGPDGRIATIAGTGQRGGTGDGGPATSARLSGATQVAPGSSGQLYIADTNNQRLRAVNLATGIIDAVAGTGAAGYGGDGGFAGQAQLFHARGVAADLAGNIYVSEAMAHRVRKLTPLVPAQIGIVSGDGQSGIPGAALAVPLKVRVSGTAGVGVPAVMVNFWVLQGSASLSSASAVTQADGTAAVDVTLGDAAGVVTIAAGPSGLSPVRFTLRAVPRLKPQAVVGAPQSTPPVTQVSPNALVSILGEGFGPAGEADASGGSLPLNLGGVCVRFGSEPAPILRVTAGQIDVQAPALAAPGETTVQVVANCGKAEEIGTEAQPVTVLPATPEFFYWVRNADGRNPIRATQKESGANIGTPGLLAGETFSPTRPGDLITLIATGFGLTDPPLAPGQAPAGEASLPVKPAVALGGVEVPADNVVYAGAQPGAPGVYRLDMRVPEDAPDGDLPVVVRIGDVSSPGGPYLTVKRP